VQVAYAIGKAHPVGVFVETFGSGIIPDERIQAAVLEVFDLRPAAIIRDLDLLRPIYRVTSAYGHFGRPQGSNWLLDSDDPSTRTAVGPTFTWESIDRADELKVAAGR
jgi:S-adenosylmethionine synthetase